MAFVKETPKYKVGDWTVTKRRVECFNGYFEEGTKVKVVKISEYGYDLQDEEGNQITDTAWDSIE